MLQESPTGSMVIPQVTVAVISGIFGLVSVIASYIIAKSQSSLKAREIELKAKEIEESAKRLINEMESLKQSQLTSVLQKRLETYPKLWAVLVEYCINRKMLRIPRDGSWAKEFLRALNDCNAEIGIFFSQSVYYNFVQFRSALSQIETKYANGEEVSQAELDFLDSLWYGADGMPGLATKLKDDLGSYRSMIIQTVA
jgi:hypothetical protein